MWALLDSQALGGAQYQQANSSAKQADKPSQRLDNESSRALRGNARREFLSSSCMRAIELNVVLHAGYTDADAQEKYALFFLNIMDNAGEVCAWGGPSKIRRINRAACARRSQSDLVPAHLDQTLVGQAA
eukprot:3643329-Pleurochrysis_carterae.AAC.2